MGRPKTPWAVARVALVLVACGGGDDADGDTGDNGTDGGGDGGQSGGAVVEQQPAGQALVRVDGREYTLTAGFDCVVEEEEFRGSFVIGDNEVVAGGGAIRNPDGGWQANPSLTVAEPEDEPGPIGYFFPDTLAVDVAVDGASASMAGQMQKTPANDGSNPPPIDVGEGVFTFTCP